MQFPTRWLAGLAAGAAIAGIAQAAPYMFVVYGDSRAGDDCKGNAIHSLLVGRMVKADPVFVVNTGDMITGYSAATNWVARGTCPVGQNGGSLKEIIAALQERKPPPGLPMAYFPVVGNHDDNWGSKWYPDKAQQGICDAFDMRALVPNHPSKRYYNPRKPPLVITDEQFYAGLCSTSDRAIYPRFAYYSFDYEDAHFVVTRINNNEYNLDQCTACRDRNDYSDYYNIHQLHWLEADLEAARKNPKVKHIFAFTHAVVLGSGDQHPNVASSARLLKVFSQYGVKVVFSGHTHAYERTWPVYADEKLPPEGERDDQKGTVYITTGGGGSPLHGFKQATPWYTAVRKSVFNYVEVTVDGDTVKMKAIGVDGAPIDEVRR